VKLQLLPSTITQTGLPDGQHLTCFVIDDRVAIDAGSLAMAASAQQREKIRDIVLTHAHLDHIAGLPLFVDDLFATLDSPIRVHGSAEVIEVLDRDIFNWSVYPDFAELENEFGRVLEYSAIEPGKAFKAAHLNILPVKVNHKVPSAGFVISDGSSRIAITGDTAEANGFWDVINGAGQLDALLIECAFPDEMASLADISHHLTPGRLNRELEKFKQECPVYAVNIKPMYREAVLRELAALDRKVEPLTVGKTYEF
jgi:cAMP phosphodiesterase